MLRTIQKKILHAVLGDYQYWKVFAIDLPRPAAPLPDNCGVRQITCSELSEATDPELKKRAAFDGPEAIGFGLFFFDQLACVQWYWWGARYQTERAGRSWELPSGAAKSVGLYTVPLYRGRGFAILLKQTSANLMYEKGFVRLYSRIWHSHIDSIRVSKKAGWTQIGSYVEICPLGYRFCFRLTRRCKV